MMHYPLSATLPNPLMYSLRTKFLLKYDAIFSHSCLASSCARCFFSPHSNMIGYPFLAALPYPFLYSFLTVSLLEYNAISSTSCRASSCARFFDSH